jgi:hypothetical protein
MAKIRDEAISAEDLAEYLATQGDDFDLELYVYREAKACGLTATHGGTYEDPVTKKTRQYDVRAYKVGNNCRVDLAIECKSLKPSFPLLLSRVPRAAEESFHELVYAYEAPAGAFIVGLLPGTALRISGAASIYPRGDYVAKNTAQVGRNEKGELISTDSEVFDKWSQALASAHELVLAARYHNDTYKSKEFVTLVLPMLVVPDGTLWAADYSEDGVLQTKPHQVSEARLFVGREYSTKLSSVTTISHMHISTRTNIAAFLRGIGQGDLLNSFFPVGAIKNAIAAR